MANNTLHILTCEDNNSERAIFSKPFLSLFGAKNYAEVYAQSQSMPHTPPPQWNEDESVWIWDSYYWTFTITVETIGD